MCRVLWSIGIGGETEDRFVLVSVAGPVKRHSSACLLVCLGICMYVCLFVLGSVAGPVERQRFSKHLSSEKFEAVNWTPA